MARLKEKLQCRLRSSFSVFCLGRTEGYLDLLSHCLFSPLRSSENAWTVQNADIIGLGGLHKLA